MPIQPAARSDTMYNLLRRSSVSWVPEQPSNLLVLPTTHIGVEMELEARSINNTNPLVAYESNRDLAAGNLVTAVSDGSLRNGVELIFSRPLFGESALNAIDHMYAARDTLNLGGSARTSTHVHVNYTDSSDTMQTMRSMVATYLLIERAMCITAGPHREHNTFCVPTYLQLPVNERRYYDVVTSRDNTTAIDVVSRLGHETNRYCAMNLASLFKHGTVEYRQLGTVEKNQLVLWINLLLSLKKCGLENDVDEVLNGPDNLDAFVDQMLGPHASNCLIIDDDGRNYFSAARNRMRAARSGTVSTRGTVSVGSIMQSTSDVIADPYPPTIAASFVQSLFAVETNEYTSASTDATDLYIEQDTAADMLIDISANVRELVDLYNARPSRDTLRVRLAQVSRTTMLNLDAVNSSLSERDSSMPDRSRFWNIGNRVNTYMTLLANDDRTALHPLAAISSRRPLLRDHIINALARLEDIALRNESMDEANSVAGYEANLRRANETCIRLLSTITTIFTLINNSNGEADDNITAANDDEAIDLF